MSDKHKYLLPFPNLKRNIILIGVVLFILVVAKIGYDFFRPQVQVQERGLSLEPYLCVEPIDREYRQRCAEQKANV
jgi:hypothetical protein